MAEQLHMPNGTNTIPSPADQLREEYERQQKLFEAQPPIVQRFLEAQARQIAEAYTEQTPTLHFMLPDRVTIKVGEKDELVPVPQASREQSIGKLIDRLGRKTIYNTLRQRLIELEQTHDQAVNACASLLRYSAAMHIIHNMLPSGRTVSYISAEDEEIPNIPTKEDLEPASAIMASTDAVTEDGNTEEGRGNLQVPFVAAAAEVLFTPMGGI